MSQIFTNEAVMFLHSLGLSSTSWNDVVNNLEPEVDVISYDSPGHGGRPNNGPLSVEKWVEDIASEIETRTDKPINLVGVSMGGIQAMAVAACRPELVNSLVIADSFAWLPEDIVQSRLESIASDIESMGMLEYAHTYIDTTLKSEISLQRRDELVASIANMSHIDYQNSARACFTADIRDLLPSITCPTLVVIGSRDEKTPRPLSEAIAENIKSANLVEIEGAGHLPHIDCSERFSETIINFFSKKKVTA